MRLTGVLQDGSPPRPGVPLNPRVAITLSKGQALTIELTVVNAGGVAVPLTGTVPTLTIKKRPQDQKLLQYVAPSIVGNVATFQIPALDTKKKIDHPGPYIYDIWVTVGGALQPVVPLSPFIVEPAALETVPASIRVDPTSVSKLQFQTTSVLATRTIAGVEDDVTALVSWAGPVSPPLASVNVAGLVEALNVGSGQLVASLNGMTAALAVQVGATPYLLVFTQDKAPPFPVLGDVFSFASIVDPSNGLFAGFSVVPQLGAPANATFNVLFTNNGGITWFAWTAGVVAFNPGATAWFTINLTGAPTGVEYRVLVWVGAGGGDAHIEKRFTLIP